MLKRTTNQIIEVCLYVIKEYDESCRGFWGRPGKEGINRKIEFLQILSRLQKNPPEEAFIKIYDFYLSQKKSSRLNKLVEKALMWMLDVRQSHFTGRLYRDASAIMQAQHIFHEKARHIKSEMGSATGKNEILLMTL